MKGFKRIISILLLVLMLVPMAVRAEEDGETPEVVSANKEPVKVYIFRSDTCGYCKALMEWINSDNVQNAYGKYFEVHDYEVSGNQDNASLMQKVKDYFNVTSQGVPYMVVGDYDYPEGFAADYQIDEDGTTMGDQLIARILEVYEKDERFDVFEKLGINPDAKKDNSVAVGVISGIVILTIAGAIIVARKNS